MMDWSQLSVGVAAVAVNLYIVRTFVRFLGNHMAKNTEALTNLTVASQRMADRLDILREDVSRARP